MPEFELVLPCYNESKSLEALVKRAVLAAKEAGFTSDRFKLVMVQNGSSDDSDLTLERLSGSNLGPWFRKVSVPTNQGYGFGLWSGLRTTTAPFIAWSHADEQCDPNDAFRALEMARTCENSKILVKGSRKGRRWKDVLVSRAFEIFAMALLGLRVYEVNAQPKVFPRGLLLELADPPKTFAFDLYVLFKAVKAGYTVKTLRVLFPPRAHGQSNWASTFGGRYKTIVGMIGYMRELSRKEGRV